MKIRNCKQCGQSSMLIDGALNSDYCLQCNPKSGADLRTAIEERDLCRYDGVGNPDDPCDAFIFEEERTNSALQRCQGEPVTNNPTKIAVTDVCVSLAETRF